jgi:hypothetical protein
LDRRALVGAALVLALLPGSCLWSPDINEREGSSFPPVIDRTLVSPSPDSIVELVSLTTEFSADGAITDMDTDIDTLEYHWYLGYLESPIPKGPDFTAQKTIRLNACAFKEELDPPGSYHTLELIVSDQPIAFDRENGRVISGGYGYVSWTVRSQVACP